MKSRMVTIKVEERVSVEEHCVPPVILNTCMRNQLNVQSVYKTVKLRKCEHLETRSEQKCSH